MQANNILEPVTAAVRHYQPVTSMPLDAEEHPAGRSTLKLSSAYTAFSPEYRCWHIFNQLGPGIAARLLNITAVVPFRTVKRKSLLGLSMPWQTMFLTSPSI